MEPIRMSLRDALRIPASDVTDEVVYHDRRRLLAAFAASPTLLLAGCSDAARTARTHRGHARAGEGGFRTNEELTRYADVTSYNNFYEFGSGKADPSHAAKTLRTKPWHVLVGGECTKPGRLSLDDLLKGFTPEERIYRLRCVEGWSMVIPWLGVPLGPVLKRFEPTSKAKYVAFVTLGDPAQMPGIRYPILDWPYREGLRIDEAMHPLAFLATGLYGKPLPQQNGAPLRLLVPWKYGFKASSRSCASSSSNRCRKPRGMPRNRRSTGSSRTSIRRWTIRAGARRPNAASPAARASCSPNASDAAVQRLRAPGRVAVRGHGPEEVVLNAARPLRGARRPA
jgi:sulfoxide reductase catalytic subunit YedY